MRKRFTPLTVWLLKKLAAIFSLLCFILLFTEPLLAKQPDPLDKLYISFSKQDVTINSVFKEINKQTGLTVFFSHNLLDEQETVGLSTVRMQLKTLLDLVLIDRALSYKLNGKVIVLQKKSEATSTNTNIKATPPVKVTGIVTDEKGEPLEGVSIVEKGTQNVTVTKNDGRFSMEVKGEKSILEISYVGYEKQEVSAANHSLIISLKNTQAQLEQVVVVGYGIQKKETVTGSVVSVGNKELMQTPVSNVGNALVGRVAGLTATQFSGEPGDNAATLRIRGVGTLNSSGQEPLVIIDGIQSTFSIMNAIDANEIENISVLKDASATAVYGVRGANGVVIVTTKRGNSGRPQINFTSNYGLTSLATKLKMLGSYEYALFRNEAIRTDGDASMNRYLFTDDELWKFQNNRDYTPAEVAAMSLQQEQKNSLLESPALYYTSHDYFDEQFGGASPQQQYNINISGGGERVRYFTSLGYFSQKGLFNHSDYGGADVNSFYSRYNFRSNYDIEIIKNLKISVDLAGQFGSNGGILGNSQDGDITGPYSRHKAMLVSILSSTPYNGPGLVDGHLISGFVGTTNPMQGKNASGFSPITNLLSRPYLTRKNTNLNANIKLVHTMDYITKGLSLTGTVSYNDNYITGVYRSTPVPQYTATRNPANPAEILYFGGAVGPVTITDNYNNNKWRRIYFESALNYKNNFGKHGVSGLVLMNAQRTHDPGLLFNVPAGLMGAASRITYNYNQRYLVEFNMGYNGSENFPEKKRFGFFPAYSLGWVVSNEAFFPHNIGINNLKIRGSHGEVGNDQVAGRRFLYLPSTWGYGSLSGISGYYFGNSNGTSRDPFYAGAYETTVGNPDVTWERAKKSNIGLEISFLKNRLSFTGDLFQEKRDNILWNLGTVPATVGASLPPANIGKVSNKGYEAQLGWNDRVGNLSYNLGFNLSYARNKIEYMSEPAYAYPWMNSTGFSIGQYKGLKTAGFYNNEKEASTHPYSSIDGNKVQAGDLRYIDIDGDGVIDSKDRVPIGYSNLPRYAFSSTMGLNYKGFGLSILLTGTAQGSFVLSDFYLLNPFYQASGAAMAFQYEGRWTPEKAAQGIESTFPRSSLRNYSTQNGVVSDFWVKSSDHIRLKNVEISYTFQNIDIFKKAGMKGIRIYANGNNLYTWSNLIDGIDPEQQASNGANSGYVYPMTRIFNFGTSIQF